VDSEDTSIKYGDEGTAMKSETIDAIGGYVFPIGLIAMLGTPAVWAYQILYWLRYGSWKAITVSDALRWGGLSEPHFAWGGVQKISDFLMAAPFSVAWFFLVMGLLLGFIEWSERYTKKQAPVVTRGS
jgi:hypothetical protein